MVCEHNVASSLSLNGTIDDYTEDRSDCYVVFNMLLCGLNLCVLVSYEARMHKLAPNRFTKYLSLT